MQNICEQKVESIAVRGVPAREGAVLGYTALGLSSKAIARKLSCSPRNVENLRDSAKSRLHASNTPNLIAIAFQKGILRFMSIALVVLGAGTGLVPQPAQADDDPTLRRIRTHRMRRGSRRIRHGYTPPAAINQLYIEYFNLQAELSWDDGEMHVHYVPSSPLQTQPYAQIFDIEDLLRWHSEQFYSSFNPAGGHDDGQASEDQCSRQDPERETNTAAPEDARQGHPG
ncbi:MAG: hypothetical protein CMK70_13455 [Pseudohongiella sp.]|nr:hypothetical protein [Pseudohongiella sp.]